MAASACTRTTRRERGGTGTVPLTRRLAVTGWSASLTCMKRADGGVPRHHRRGAAHATRKPVTKVRDKSGKGGHSVCECTRMSRFHFGGVAHLSRLAHGGDVAAARRCGLTAD